MATPSIVQSKELPLTQQTGTTSVALDAACAAGNSLYLRLFSDVNASNSSDPVVVTATPAGGSAVPMELIAFQGWLYEANKRISVWRLDGVEAQVYTITVNGNGPAVDVELRGLVDEVADAGGVEAFVLDTTFDSSATEHGATSVALGPLPSSGDFAGDEILALAFSAASNGAYADIDWGTPADWTKQLDQGDGTNGKPPFAAYSRTLAVADPLSVTITSAVADAFGRAGMLLALVNSGPPTQQRIRVEHGDDTLDGEGGITVEVFANPPTGHTFTGTKLFEVSGLAWANEDIGGGVIRSVLEFDVPPVEDWFTTSVPITTGGTVVVGGGVPGVGAELMGDAAFVGYATGSVIEVEIV